ncbi:MAG: sortase, partial [Chloroflexi bacterium]|nr:sortase [Chloroflexota bacterium]
TLGLLAVTGSLMAPLPTMAQSDGSDGQDSSSGTGYGAAEWMRIPTIGVDSHITDVGVVDGFYDVPWFDIGHHADSHNPGEAGNCIFNGHVATINAGEVFRHLDQLQRGDAIYVYTPAYRLDWVVTDSFPVDQDDNSFLDDTPEAQVTLYTCTGEFNPIERSFAQRLVVTAQWVQVGLRT